MIKNRKPRAGTGRRTALMGNPLIKTAGRLTPPGLAAFSRSSSGPWLLSPFTYSQSRPKFRERVSITKGSCGCTSDENTSCLMLGNALYVYFLKRRSQVWWHIPVIPAPRKRLPGQPVSSRLARATGENPSQQATAEQMGRGLKKMTVQLGTVSK